jgi:hypothetical protein
MQGNIAELPEIKIPSMETLFVTNIAPEYTAYYGSDYCIMPD